MKNLIIVATSVIIIRVSGSGATFSTRGVSCVIFFLSLIHDLLQFIPSSFLKSHNIQMKPQVKLHDEKGRQWPIKIEMLYESQRVTVTSGWSEFVNKNLKLGDYCVLEFVLEQQNRCGEIHVQICGADLKTERRNRYSVVVP